MTHPRNVVSLGLAASNIRRTASLQLSTDFRQSFTIVTFSDENLFNVFMNVCQFSPGQHFEATPLVRLGFPTEGFAKIQKVAK